MAAELSRVPGLCYSENMLIVQQRGTFLRPRHSLAPSWLGQLLLAVVAVTLVFGPLSLRDATPHGASDSHTATSNTLAAEGLHGLLPSDAAEAQGATPATTPHSHCVIHCSLASLLFPLLLLGAPLLATRLVCSLSPACKRLAAPPLSPPPQSAH